MRSQHIQDWINALRSGNYRQAHQALKRGNGYCCLGVACDLAGATWTDGVYPRWDFETVTNNSSYLPAWLRELLDLTSWQQAELVGLNDSGSSFNYIAETLEEWFPIEEAEEAKA